MPNFVYVARAPDRRVSGVVFSPAEWSRLAGFYGFIGALHVLGWGLYLHYAPRFPQLVGLGFVAYMFGLRHAFDADHIAAVDDTVRFMLQKGKQPLGVGFFFSLGHSTVVLALALGIAYAAGTVSAQLPPLKELGAVIGAGVSGTFLWLIGILNLLVLLDILKIWRTATRGTHSHAHLDALLQKRGLINRLFGARLQGLMQHSWQMYPLGLLFGLGFDTASEVGLLAMTAGASAGNLPGPAVLCLPLLFAAGMTAMDTTDGVLMCKAYDWAFLNPLRKIFYNITTTGLSVAVALLVGTIELSQVVIGALDLHGPLVDFITRLDFGILGYFIVGLFLAAWGLSVALWKFGRIEQRYSIAAIAALALAAVAPGAARADTVASLLGNFTINQYCALKLGGASLGVHYAVVFGQLPALRELHNADADGNGVTSQAERDAYVGKLASGFAEGLDVRLDGAALPLRATHWTSSLPTEQGGFSLRIDVDFDAALPHLVPGTPHRVQLTNQNYAGRPGWHEIAVEATPGVFVYDTNAYANSLTGGLREALQALPRTGPLDERAVYMTFNLGNIPASAVPLAARREAMSALPAKVAAAPGRKLAPLANGAAMGWLARATGSLVASISAPRLQPGVAVLALLGALSLGAVHALSPGHGKTIVGAYLIGSRGTPRHAAFLGLTVTMTHTACVFILGFATLYASRFIVPERLFPVLSMLSAVLVLGLGLVLLVQRARAARQALSGARRTAAPLFYAVRRPSLIYRHPASITHLHTGGLTHSHGGGAMHSHLPPEAAGDRITWRSMLALGVSGGLVPCPSAMVLLLAAVALNKTAYGMLLVLAFSVGLALTLTVVGLAFLYARTRLRRPNAAARWPHLLPVMSAGTITALGVALCCGALRSFG